MTPPQRTPQQPPVLAPAIELVREADALLLLISLPGVKAGDFRLSLIGNRQVHIEGNLPERHPVPGEYLVQAEQPGGLFARTVDLPIPVDGEHASTSLHNGLLWLRLPLQVQNLPLG